jgi:hypothetical protein
MSRDMSFEEFFRELAHLENKVIESVEIAVNEVAEDLLSISQELAPLDEGGLMESGSTEPAVYQNGEIKGRVGYTKEYAIRMHEDVYNLGETSKQKPNVDGMTPGRKYLSKPLDKYGQKYTDHIMSKMEGALND